jgi:hypothetical protein
MAKAFHGVPVGLPAGDLLGALSAGDVVLGDGVEDGSVINGAGLTISQAGGLGRPARCGCVVTHAESARESAAISSRRDMNIANDLAGDDAVFCGLFGGRDGMLDGALINLLLDGFFSVSSLLDGGKSLRVFMIATH